ncbi:GNAT family N-acetyltransferase [Alkaliphilus serpentinus]|uniref:GNAT family N-acetyltransferase n=1 Tax=Alkaliphilus serpentinus TaxID=1482731 RepID=A0A833HQU9_9FIRM|nr:GNAT family N-acetyltransferase [Alkaliphilus serpentinus]KAB3532189.1 GNAT family N-acetyltransferase [Alkaliphilus serpentinus]
MVIAQGEISYIIKLQRNHVDEMDNWGIHNDPLFLAYNFPKMDILQKHYWFYRKNYTFSRKCFVAFNNQNKLVGYIALRDIRMIRRSAEMGIVFDPNYLDKGYGTDALKAFIPYYFETMKMKKLILRVAEFNHRARKCYLNCGFKVEKLEYNPFEDQSVEVFKDKSIEYFRDYFKIEKGVLQCRFIHMLITKEGYEKQKNIYPHYPPNTCA